MLGSQDLRGWKEKQTAKAAKELGCKSVEIIGPKHWPMLKEHGLTCAIAEESGEATNRIRTVKVVRARAMGLIFNLLDL